MAQSCCIHPAFLKRRLQRQRKSLYSPTGIDQVFKACRAAVEPKRYLSEWEAAIAAYRERVESDDFVDQDEYDDDTVSEPEVSADIEENKVDEFPSRSSSENDCSI